MFVHLTLVPYIPSAGELKTKPTQHSVKELLNVGIQPHMLLCRCDRPIPDNERRKIALFCNVRPEAVIPALDVDTIYAVPIRYHDEGMDREVLRHFGLPFDIEPDLVALGAHRRRDARAGRRGAHRGGRQIHQPARQLQIARRGADAWRHRQSGARAARLGGQPGVRAARRGARLEGVHGILVPGGFGERGTEGKIAAVRFARERQRAVPRHLLRHADGGDRGGAQSGGAARGVLHRVRPVRHAGGRPADRMGARQRDRAARWKAAIWAARCGSAPIPPCCATAAWCARIYGGAPVHRGASSSPLRGERALQGVPGGDRAAVLRHVAGRRAAGDHRDAPAIRGSSACSIIRS